MDCRLFGTRPLPEPMMNFSQLNSWEQILMKFESEFYHFYSRKCIWNCCLPIWQPFCPGGDEFTVLALLGQAITLLPEPMLTYQLNHQTYILMKFNLKFEHFPLKNEFEKKKEFEDVFYKMSYMTFSELKTTLNPINQNQSSARCLPLCMGQMCDFTDETLEIMIISVPRNWVIIYGSEILIILITNN